MSTSLEIVLKITERCNINCDYCYMFNHGNDDYRSHPPVIDESVLDSMGAFVRDAVSDLGVRRVVFVLHGGEPLLMKPARFEALCARLRDSVPPGATCSFGVQTNAMLVDDAWIDVFSRWRIGVGVSLDGPRHLHDEKRPDHQGRGTYEATVLGLRRMQDAARAGRLIGPPGAICVTDATRSGREVYRHLVDDLGIANLSFMLPMEHHDSTDLAYRDGIGRFLAEVVEEWIADDDPGIRVRQIDGFAGFLAARGIAHPEDESTLICIASSGAISIADETKGIGFGQNLGHVATARLREILDHPAARHYRAATRQVAPACADCEWVGYCRGGSAGQMTVNRYSRRDGFGNPSVFCDGLKSFYATVTRHLMRRGLRAEAIVEALANAAEPVDVRAREHFADDWAACAGPASRAIPILPHRA